jgi:hypothetical protein
MMSQTPWQQLDRFCHGCGLELYPATPICPNCGTPREFNALVAGGWQGPSPAGPAHAATGPGSTSSGRHFVAASLDALVIALLVIAVWLTVGPWMAVAAGINCVVVLGIWQVRARLTLGRLLTRSRESALPGRNGQAAPAPVPAQSGAYQPPTVTDALAGSRRPAAPVEASSPTD